MRRIALVTGCVLLAALSGCSSSSSPSSPTPVSTPTATATATPTATSMSSSSTPVAADTITIQSFAFHPAALTVAPGATVTVINKDSVTHTLTSTSNPKAFDTGDIAAGATKTFKAPSKAGAYPYNCSIHTFMLGTLTVQ